MQAEPRKAVLNRPVFTQTAFSSDALTVLTTWIHRFAEPGRHQVRVAHVRRPERSFVVLVSPDATQLQHNVDLTALVEGEAGCCDEGDAYELAVGGVMGFYPSAGIGGFTVRVTHLGEKEKGAPADNGRAIPEGDLFAVTLTRPGLWAVWEEGKGSRAEVRVSLPREGRLRTDRPALVRLGREGFEGTGPEGTGPEGKGSEGKGLKGAVLKGDGLEMHAGQSLVVLCGADARLRVELVEDGTGEGRAKGASGRGSRRTTHGRPAERRKNEKG